MKLRKAGEMSDTKAMKSARADLDARFEKPTGFDTATALRIVGKRGEVHPRDAYAFAYESVEAAEAYAAANAAHWGIPSLGVQQLETGPAIGVLDFRPHLRAYYDDEHHHPGEVYEPTDPSLPDDWQPPPRPPRPVSDDTPLGG